ncbi:MAG TPA: hypothetical protein DCQ52_11235 [Acidimicrobiaceae bacterium]|nr:hypothetical protein [Acidimicrobiaceae bacterium]
MAQIGPMNPGKLANTASIEASKPRNGSPARVANSASTPAAVTSMVTSVGRRSRGAPAGTAKKRPVNACSAVPSCTCMTPRVFPTGHADSADPFRFARCAVTLRLSGDHR